MMLEDVVQDGNASGSPRIRQLATSPRRPRWPSQPLPPPRSPPRSPPQTPPPPPHATADSRGSHLNLPNGRCQLTDVVLPTSSSCGSSEPVNRGELLADAPRSARRASFADSRVAAAARLASRGGHRDRRLGAWSVPEEDIAEPERTERLLSQPFALRRRRTGDAFQAREGFLMFRVNGSNRLGVLFRLVVMLANVSFGVLSGITPLLKPGSLPALAQTSTVLTLQAIMSWICFCRIPDADMIVSLFAGLQFLLEAIASALLLIASLRFRGMGDWGAGVQPPSNAPIEHTHLLLSAFWAGLLAIGVPVVQMIEQRCITPAMLTVRNRGGNPLVLCAAAYMLITSLPTMIGRIVQRAAGLSDGVSEAINAADGTTSGAADVEGAEGDGAAGEPGEEEVGISADMIGDAAAKVSKLLARGLAAKEADGKVLARPSHAVGQSSKVNISEKSASRKSAAESGEATQDDGGLDDGGGDE